MKSRSAVLLAILSATLAAPAGAQGEIQLPAFEQVELRGGGRVVVRHGAVQRVRLLRGSREISNFQVDRNGRLRIDACRSSCRNYRLEVEIVTPRIEALAIQGGGEIEGAGAFPAQRTLAAAVNGGGEIDARAFAARDVSAAVNGGGTILTDPGASLSAAVRGGGSVRYWGDPSVSRAVSGGGEVVRAR